MCLILFALDCHPDYQLIMAANRDESYQRHTLAAQFWDEHPQLLAGRDMQAGGTWIGMNRNGRLAALTNLRSNRPFRNDAPSRGTLVRDFALGNESQETFLESLMQKAQGMNGFNLLFGVPERLLYYSSLSNRSSPIPAGVHGLSNECLNGNWPKIGRGKSLLKRALEEEKALNKESLFALLCDHHTAADADLPDTGVGLEMERILSPLFIISDSYGTRSSTLLLVKKNGDVQYSERSYFSGTTEIEQQRDYQFNYREPS